MGITVNYLDDNHCLVIYSDSNGNVLADKIIERGSDEFIRLVHIS